MVEGQLRKLQPWAAQAESEVNAGAKDRDEFAAKMQKYEAGAGPGTFLDTVCRTVSKTGGLDGS